MWNKSNWCERIMVTSAGVLLFLLLFNVFIQQAVFNIWLVLYTVLVIVGAVWITCMDVQFLLGQSAPLKYQNPRQNHSMFFLGSVIPLLRDLYVYQYGKPEPRVVDANAYMDFLDVSTSSDVSIISSVIERKCIWSWYSSYVSKEIAFPFACKELLDQTVAKVFQVSVNVDTVHLCSDSLGVVLRHCKEYKRAVKRLEKNGKGKIEEYYKNTHPTSAQRTSITSSSRIKSTQGHCLLLTRAILKELLPWELWGTPHAHLLASILAKYLNLLVESSLSNPIWLKNNIMKLLDENHSFASKASDIKPNKTDNNGCVKEDNSVLNKSDSPGRNTPQNGIKNVVEALEKHDTVDEVGVSIMKTSIESALTNMISNSTAPILQRAEMDGSNKMLQSIVAPLAVQEESTKKTLNVVGKKISKPIDITGSPSRSLNGYDVLNGKKNNSNEVKIYDRVVEGSVKTWNSDVDLESVSMGHDLLASLDGDIGFESRLGRLWEADGTDSNEAWSPNGPSTGSSTKTPHGLWFGEEDTLELDLQEDSPPKSTVHTNTSYTNFNISKPLSIHNMKELQNISKNTVSQAKHKIGDLQDEAAGVMEGILDLGMAGLRKGLRLTGLQESPTDKPSTPAVISKTLLDNPASNLVATIGQVLTSSRKNSQSDESTIKSDAPKNTVSNVDCVDKAEVSRPLLSQNASLVKQQRVVSQDSTSVAGLKEKEVKEKLTVVPPVAIDPVVIAGESPDYEYEEAEDFASTIAKLRCLLQEKTGDVTPVPSNEVSPQNSQDLKGSQFPGVSNQMKLNNSPMHKPMPIQQTSSESDGIPLNTSLESENGFTILSVSTELGEAEEALNHKISQSSLFGSSTNISQGNVNNMQRLDKLFTRTVTGVFNTIKTAVGGDSVSDVVTGNTDVLGPNGEKQTMVRSQHKGEWIFVEGDVDVSILVGRLLVERRGFCVVEAAQDSLEVLGGAPLSLGGTSQAEATCPPNIPDDMDEADLFDDCPLWRMCFELISIALGGVLQKDAIVKCTSIAAADFVESILQDNLDKFTVWLREEVLKMFREISKKCDGISVEVPAECPEPMSDVEVHKICELILAKIPELLFVLFGQEQILAALTMLLSSVECQLINRDVVFNLLDVVVLHFLQACKSKQKNCMLSPPPSA